MLGMIIDYNWYIYLLHILIQGSYGVSSEQPTNLLNP